mgnify:CR=1 FL=1
MRFPRVARIRQHFPDHSIQDIPATLRQRLHEAGLASALPPGSSVAIAAGSRGISNIATIVRTVADYWRESGMRPFIFPAMGSHGAATAAGQANVLAHYGITEAAMGCPIVSQLDVVSTGTSAAGIETYVDKAAFESAGIMLVNRVKWHTDFHGEIESGLFKMMAIGLGKFAGARRYHTHAFRMGLEAMILEVGRQILATGKILGGVAIVEDANHHTAEIAVLPAADFERREKELLAKAKAWKPRIPVPAVDILTVDEMGKNISGTGMDTKVVNRGVQGEYNPWPDTPLVTRLFVRGLTEETEGNGVGIGMADITTSRLLRRINWGMTNLNALTSGPLASVRAPLHYETDRKCLETLWPTVGKLDLGDVTYCRIRNTLELGRAVISENLLEAALRNGRAELLGEPAEMRFDADGNLLEELGPEQDW